MSTGVREPAWLTAAVDQRIAFMLGQMDLSMIATGTVIFTFLTEPPEGAKPIEQSYWEHACDNCGRYSRSEVMTGTVERLHQGHKILVQFGACAACRAAS